MSKYNLIFDVARCNSCNNCVLATKDEYLGNSFPGYSEPAPRLGDLWLTLARHERGAAPMIDVSHYIETCQQCDNPPCLTPETSDVVSKRADGIVVIDPVKARGRRDLVGTCPYGQIHWNEELQLPQKWSMDAHLLDNGWKEPRAVQSCPTQALTLAKLDDAQMDARANDEGLVRLHSELGTRPRIWYRNFDRVSHCFLGGALVRRETGREDCAAGLRVRLLQDNKVLMEQDSDPFGEFKFEPLEGRGEVYRLQVAHATGAVVFETDVTLDDNTYLGVIEVR
ncbi:MULTISPECIES: 4Fe-4S dicluster domain-containing protein [unclassified Novosphingobium]|uniref:4Fe-4S dicluster domain-containing protein n=1 Tax=unclassified Novosphingobium TaxID=2644732 RepID=UPI00146E9FB2|nr:MULTISPECIES: 4Fe-4S dicluster domain-containing protein [unclassified Novosphingobium]NMN04598.1 Fe-S-cluster-containing dehydrogenase component [Novosphingobium sp. SG919]NMN85409.1 Fe-S-cluster-containing dehydrogenase component [Novosphingobium sp. SG916]